MQEHLNAQIILTNTYHTYLRPGSKIIEKMKGLHNFSGFKNSFLTNSGSFQAFSSPQSRFDDNGIIFKSHIDGVTHKFTPKKVIDIVIS